MFINLLIVIDSINSVPLLMKNEGMRIIFETYSTHSVANYNMLSAENSRSLFLIVKI